MHAPHDGGIAPRRKANDARATLWMELAFWTFVLVAIVVAAAVRRFDP